MKKHDSKNRLKMISCLAACSRAVGAMKRKLAVVKSLTIGASGNHRRDLFRICRSCLNAFLPDDWDDSRKGRFCRSDRR